MSGRKQALRGPAWLPTTDLGRFALALTLGTLLSPVLIIAVLSIAVNLRTVTFPAGMVSSELMLTALLAVTVTVLWTALLGAKERSVLVGFFALVLSATLMLFITLILASPSLWDRIGSILLP